MQADSFLVGHALASFKPPPMLLPSQFAEQQLYLPASSNAISGPLRLTAYPTGMLDAFADQKTHTLVFCCASQIGKSLTVDSLVGYAIACAPGPILHVSPTAARAEDWVRDRFDPLVKSSPSLRALIGGGRKGGGDSLSHKMFPGGSLNLASSFQPDTLAARAIRNVFLDEIDRFAASAGTEGDPVMLAIKRTRTFFNRKIVLVSTPTSRIGSRIAKWFERGDQRRWHVACPDCGQRAPLAFENLKWGEGKPESAHLVCAECGCVHDEQARRRMIAGGEWKATATGEPGVASFHINELASPFSSLASVAQQYESADTPDKKRVFYNTALGETFDSSTEIELDAGELQARAESISEPYDATILAITVGCDVQANRLEATWLAHTAVGVCTVINHLVFNGDTSAPQVWLDLDAALGATFRLKDGRQLAVAATAVDSGFAADQVVAFVQSQRRKSRRCIAIKGVAGFDRPALKEGGRLKNAMRVWLAGVDGLKLSISKRLGMTEMGPSYIRLPDHLDSTYFDGLASEELRTKDVRGFARYQFFKTVKANEALDCLVYAVAAATLPNIMKPVASAPAAPRKSVAEMAAQLNALHNGPANQRTF